MRPRYRSHYDAPKSIKLNDRRCLQPQLLPQQRHYRCILMEASTAGLAVITKGQPRVLKQHLSAFRKDLQPAFRSLAVSVEICGALRRNRGLQHQRPGTGTQARSFTPLFIAADFYGKERRDGRGRLLCCTDRGSASRLRPLPSCPHQHNFSARR